MNLAQIRSLGQDRDDEDEMGSAAQWYFGSDEVTGSGPGGGFFVNEDPDFDEAGEMGSADASMSGYGGAMSGPLKRKRPSGVQHLLDLPEAFVPGFGHGAPSPYKRRKMKKKYKNKLERDAHSLLTKHHITERRRFDSEHELTLQKEKISDFLAEVHMGRRRRRPGAMEKVEPPPKKQKKEPEAAEKPEEKEYTPDVDVRDIAEQYKPTTTVDPSLTEKYLGDEPATEPVSGPPEVAPPPPPGVAPPQSTVPDILQRYAEETPGRPSLTAALPRVPPPPPPMHPVACLCKAPLL